jgi:uncharacterized protein YbaR (Trm112 family)
MRSHRMRGASHTANRLLVLSLKKISSRPTGAPPEGGYKSRSDRPPRRRPVRQDESPYRIHWMPTPITQAGLRFLACPVCHGALLLPETIPDTLPARILCLSCHRSYPIVDGLPILLAARATLSS